MQISEARRKASEIVSQAEADAAKAAEKYRSSSRILGTDKSRGDYAAGLGRHLDLLPEERVVTPLPTSVSKSFPEIHRGECRALAIAATKSTLASCGADMVVHLWNIDNGSKLASLRVCSDFDRF